MRLKIPWTGTRVTKYAPLEVPITVVRFRRIGEKIRSERSYGAKQGWEIQRQLAHAGATLPPGDHVDVTSSTLESQW